jgi:hypothetical protein
MIVSLLYPISQIDSFGIFGRVDTNTNREDYDEEKSDRDLSAFDEYLNSEAFNILNSVDSK